MVHWRKSPIMFFHSKQQKKYQWTLGKQEPINIGSNGPYRALKLDLVILSLSYTNTHVYFCASSFAHIDVVGRQLLSYELKFKISQRSKLWLRIYSTFCNNVLFRAKVISMLNYSLKVKCFLFYFLGYPKSPDLK